MRYTDPDLKYCPRCDEEYRAEIEYCVSCNVELLSGKEKLSMEEEAKRKKQSRNMEILPGDEISPIRKGPLHDMKQLQRLLASENIPSMLTGDRDSCGKGCCGGGDLYLQIRISDAEEAFKVLASEFRETTALDSHDLSTAHVVFDTGAEESICPACGCNFSTINSTCPDCGLCF